MRHPIRIVLWLTCLLLLVVTEPVRASGNPIPQGGSNTTNGGSNVVISTPTATSSTNNLLVGCVFAVQANADITFTLPSGWTEIKACTSGASTGINHLAHLDCSWHVWTSGETSYTWNVSSGAPFYAGFIEAFSGATISPSPIDVTGSCSQALGASATAIPATGLTPNYTNDTDIAVWVGSQTTSSITVDASTTALSSAATSVANAAENGGSIALSSASPVGTLNGATSSVVGYAAVQFALLSASPATPGPTPTAAPTATPASYHGEVILFGF
jgi:hypothetical protein